MMIQSTNVCIVLASGTQISVFNCHLLAFFWLSQGVTLGPPASIWDTFRLTKVFLPKAIWAWVCALVAKFDIKPDNSVPGQTRVRDNCWTLVTTCILEASGLISWSLDTLITWPSARLISHSANMRYFLALLLVTAVSSMTIMEFLDSPVVPAQPRTDHQVTVNSSGITLKIPCRLKSLRPSSLNN